MNLTLSIWLSDGFALIVPSSYPHRTTQQNGVATEKENTILFFFHQQNIHD